MKITFSGTAEEIAAAIRAVAGVGEVQIRVAEPAWRKMAEEVAQEMRAAADGVASEPKADAPKSGDDFFAHGEDQPDPTEQRIKREDVRLEAGDEVKHGLFEGGKWFLIRDHVGPQAAFPLWAHVYTSLTGETNVPNLVPPVTHFRRNGITYTIED